MTTQEKLAKVSRLIAELREIEETWEEYPSVAYAKTMQIQFGLSGPNPSEVLNGVKEQLQQQAGVLR